MDSTSTLVSDKLSMPAHNDIELAQNLDEDDRAVAADHSFSNSRRRLPSSSAAGDVSSRRAQTSPSSAWASFVGSLDFAVLNLAPSFFSLNMGTGIVSILLHQLPYNAEWLKRLSIVVFVFNVVLFVLLAIGNVIRYVRYKGLFTAVLHHLVSSMFWGTLPMGFVTIVNMICLACVPSWGWHGAQLALGLMWIDLVLSVIVNIGMLWIMFTRHNHTPESVAAIWLLPIVTCVVVASTTALVAQTITPFAPQLARSTLLVAFVTWGTGVPIALMVIALWISRLTMYGPPPAVALTSTFLPLGPCGQGAYGIALMGLVARDLAYQNGISFAIALEAESAKRIGDGVYAVCLVTSLIIWGLGLVWYILAHILIIEQTVRDRTFFGTQNFSVGFTAITFPVGVWASASIILATELDSMAFKIIGTVVSLQVVFNWMYVMGMTVWKAWKGTFWVDPALNGFEGGRPPLRFGSKHSR